MTTSYTLIATELVKQCGIFPSTVEKDALAEALVAAFPTLGNFFFVQRQCNVLFNHSFSLGIKDGPPPSSSAFKILFSSFFLLQLHYPSLIKPMYKFFEERVFKISSSMSSTTAEFVSRLESPRCVA